MTVLAILARRVLFCSAAAVTLLSALTALGGKPDAGPQPPQGTPPEQLSQILGTDLAAWKITKAPGKPADYGIETAAGRPVLASHAGGAVLTGSTCYGPDSEIAVRFRMAPADRATSVSLQAGLQNPGDSKEAGLHVSLSARPGENAVSWQVADPLAVPPRRPVVSGSYDVRGIGQRSLTWPDDLRKLIEDEIASLPPLEEKWLTVRYQLRPEAFRVYLNDRLLIDRAAPGLQVAGRLRMTLGPHVQLASVRVRALAPASPLFEPIAIDQQLNASQIDGRTVAHASLPAPGEVSLVHDVPFVFPEVDARGRDHVDVGRSWLQNGFLEGASAPHRGGVAGRWVGALSENPARIQFRVPKGRYCALHLIAAADSEPDSVPIVSVQFYRPLAGAPEQVAARVPALAAKSVEAAALPVKLDNGQAARLYLVTISIDPGMLALWDDMEYLELELTKEVKLYRCYPDPSYYSFHGAGLPSSVHVYALTLQRPAVDVSLQAEAYSHVWTAPQPPAYAVAVRNRAGQPRTVSLEWATASFDGLRKTAQQVSLRLPAAGQQAVQRFTIDPQRYGYHDAILTLRDGAQVWTERRSLAWLHEDTRQRGDWQPGRGPLFSASYGAGFHHTPSAEKQLPLLGLAGAESCRALAPGDGDQEERKIAQQFQMVNFKLFARGEIRLFEHFRTDLGTMPVEQAEAKLLAALKEREIPADAVNRAEIVSFFAEPHLGPAGSGNLPSYWGEPEHEFSPEEEARYREYERAFVLGARLVKKYWPQAICTFPHGDPQFPVTFLRRSPEVRELFGGVTVDMPGFEHLPEKQLHQSAFHRLYVCREEYRKAGITNPVMAVYEGPCLPIRPGSLTPRQQADLLVRQAMILLAYGVDRQLSGRGTHAPADYWGEQHYGGGMFERIALETPRPAYVAFATMTRHLNRKNLEKWLPTGSLSVYALQFRHYQSGELTHVLWTLRGRRPVTVAVPAGAAVQVYDLMDNAVALKAQGGSVTFTVDTSPCYVTGLPGDARITLGEPDHGDAQPAADATLLARVGDGTWRLSADEDAAYAENHVYQVRRFPGEMSAALTPAPDAQGGKALAVHLGEQKIQQKFMPYYTTLVPPRPIVIPGKASHLGLWVKASSDWGRVVYCLRDAQGERWLSVGQREQWNCDDIHCWSFFCFDGWRYLRFELPANSPYDAYREAGSNWWGHSGPGDGIVDLPLTLEKIIVERRTHALYVNDPQPASPDDVLLAGLFAEYERPEDQTPEAVRLARLRMPVPAGVADLGNPIAELEKSGVGAATAVTHIALPEQEADGTQCFVHFTPVAGAKRYDIWVSPYPDGRGALKLGTGWTGPGGLIRGLRPETDFYVFAAYVDHDGKPSKPSPPLRIRLKDMFLMK